MRIGYCTWQDPFDKRSWSGFPYYMMRSLEKHCGEVIPLGPLDSKFIVLGKIINKLSTVVFKKGFDYHHSLPLAKDFSRILEKRVRNHNLDLLFFCGGCEALAFLNTNIKKVYFSDTTFDLMLGYYPDYSGLLDISRKWGSLLEKLALQNADIIIYPSLWATNSAINDYGINRDKIVILPTGINLQNLPSYDEIDRVRNANRDVLRLLFIGVDWLRKGGDIALKTMIELNKRGINTELTVAGIRKKLNIQHPKFKNVGFLDKNDPRQAEMLRGLYMESSIFFLPTRSECYGLVFSEAAAYGLPVVSTNTGGLSSHIDNNITGALLPLEADYKAYADKIQEIWLNKSVYITLSRNAKNKSDQVMNWDNWGTNFNKVLTEIK